ncbi:MAG: hypothetical protein KKE89_05360 [Actinobacteria bacterium]|nr:hypothetical protein [Actinomycetota bacterium]
MPPSAESDILRAALVAAYRPYVEQLLAARGVEVPGLEEALALGRDWLDESLAAMLARPFPQQARGPLEVFQEAMRFPTGALDAAGVEVPHRDETARTALPGDRYDLAPPSSQALGEDVWRAHLAWGAAKARAFRPTAGLLSNDLMDRSRIEPIVAAAGFGLVVWKGKADLAGGFDRPAVAFADLAHRDADAVIRVLAAEGVRVIGFGPHVDDLAMVRARSLGAADAMPRSVFFRSVARLLPTPV